MGAPASRVMIEGATFDVRVRDRLAEANRLNPEALATFETVAPRAARAMRIVSGCDVSEVRGDAAQVIGVLACGRAGTARVPDGTEAYDCVVIDRGTGDPDVVLTEDYECDLVPI